MCAKSQERDLSVFTPAYRLREEARKSWDHIVCDELVYSLKVLKIQSDVPVKIAKNYLKGDWCIECHLTFEAEGNIHYQLIVESEAPELMTPKIVQMFVRPTCLEEGINQTVGNGSAH